MNPAAVTSMLAENAAKMPALQHTTILVYPGDFRTKYKLNDGNCPMMQDPKDPTKKIPKPGAIYRSHNRHYDMAHAKRMVENWPLISTSLSVTLYEDEDGLWIADGQHRIAYASEYAWKNGYVGPVALQALIVRPADLHRLNATTETFVNLHDHGKDKQKPALHEIAQERSPWTKAFRDLGIEVEYKRSGASYCVLDDNILAGVWIADRIANNDPVADAKTMKRWASNSDALFFNYPPEKAGRYAHYIAFWIRNVATPAAKQGVDLYTREAFAFAILCMIEGLSPEQLLQPLEPLEIALSGLVRVNEGANPSIRLHTMAERVIRGCVARKTQPNIRWGYRVLNNPTQSIHNLLFVANYQLQQPPYIQIRGKVGR